ncbi:MAG: sensor histidine kinase [Bacteroidota bacterium]
MFLLGVLMPGALFPAALLAGLCLGLVAALLFLRLRPYFRLREEVDALLRGEYDLQDPQLRKLAARLRDYEAAEIDRLKLEKSELEAIINSMTEGLTIYDLDMKPVLMNPALRQLAQPATTGTRILEGNDLFRDRWANPDQILVIEEAMKQQPQRPRTDIIELVSPAQFLKRYSSPLTNEQGAQIGWVAIYHDITPEVEVDRLKSDFISNASHELRTPVTSLKVLIESLIDGAQDDPELRRTFLQDLHREIDRMHQLVNDLLDLARLESGKAPLRLDRVDVTRVIKEAVNTVAPQAKLKGIPIDLKVPAAVEGRADKDRLRQVLVNLLANAVKFTEQGGRVTVGCATEGNSLRFQVSDTGIGIPAKDLPHIFDRFFRVTRGRSRLQGGSGLGLTIVKQTIDAHQGEISIESTEGEGTTVSFTIPQG